jgi:phosphatidate cytidylyltransferase
VHDGKDSDQAVTPAEGVRIIGAEEAQAALVSERDERPGGRGEPAVDLSDAERDERQRAAAFPDAGPSWSAAEAGEAPVIGPGPAEPTSGEVPPLPHWTEPPTGAVPAIFSDDTGDHPVDDDLEAWSTIGGGQARFRAEGADWAEVDFEDDFSGAHEKLGALDEGGPVDEEAAFAEALAERRLRPGRGRPRARPSRARAPEGDVAPPGPAATRDLPTAIMTAAIVVVVALVSFSIGPVATALLACAVIGFATLELCNTLQTRGMRPATLLALTASLTVPLAAEHYGPSVYPAYLALIVIFSMLWFLWQVTPGRPLLGVAATVLSFGYVGGLGGFAGLLLGAPQDHGVGLLLGLAFCTVAYDVVGFFVGSQFGRSRVAPNVSPNKTVAGTVAGMVASVFFGFAVAGSISPWTHSRGLVLGLLVAGGAFLGDLCASMIKRDLGVKDFGSLLPGHGGVLDRFDGLLFCLPIAYYLALHWNMV